MAADPLGVMLRVHCVQLFYNVSDPGMEDLLYEVESVRRFAGLRLSGSLPDETTILRHLLAGLGDGVVRGDQYASGVSRAGDIVDASIIAPSLTKNRRGERDDEGMYFGMKASGWTAESGLATAWRRRPPTPDVTRVRAAAW